VPSPKKEDVMFKKAPSLLGITFLGLAGTTFAAVSPVTLQSFARARKVLDRALDAAGGKTALASIKQIARKGDGTVFNQGQSLRPSGEYTSRAVTVSTVADFAERRSVTETATTPSGGILTKTRAVLKGDSGFGHNLTTNVVTPTAPAGLTAARNALRRDPAILLLTADSRSETLRYLGEADLDGEKHDVISFADADGTEIALYVSGRSGLVSKQETVANNPVLGDAVTEQVFSDYRRVSGVQVPFRVVTRTAGRVTQDLKYNEITINGGLPASLLEALASASQVGAPPAATDTVAVTPLGDGAYFLGGGSHNSLLVVFKDHSLLVEAPLGEERTQALLAKIAELAPGKPLRYVVPTHYHFDHSGGLRGVIAAGATIVTTPGNKAFIEELAAAPHTIRPDELSRRPKTPVIEVFTGKRVFSDGTRTVEIYDVGPNPHIDEMAVAYLPKEKVLFVVDLFGIPAEGPLPLATPAMAQFADKIKALGLDVEKIASGHGRIGSIEDLRKALASSATASRGLD
jgi:glyoxylase-like metal-dependent hydrolase (beta-lactamase superfamily II)